jgi:hypothetical protein
MIRKTGLESWWDVDYTTARKRKWFFMNGWERTIPNSTAKKITSCLHRKIAQCSRWSCWKVMTLR